MAYQAVSHLSQKKIAHAGACASDNQSLYMFFLEHEIHMFFCFFHVHSHPPVPIPPPLAPLSLLVAARLSHELCRNSVSQHTGMRMAFRAPSPPQKRPARADQLKGDLRT